MPLPSFSFSRRAVEYVPALPFGLGVVLDVSAIAAREPVEAAKAVVVEQIAENRDAIQRHIARYRAFFESQRFDCPLTSQFSRTLKKGLPSINPFIDALLLCEMSSGVLMGVQDLDSVEGAICYDIAEGGEKFQGFRGQVECRSGEIILRDAVDIVASYFQGPDFRTRITPSTRNLIFFGFSAPGIDLPTLELAIRTAVHLLEPAAASVEYQIKTPD